VSAEIPDGGNVDGESILGKAPDGDQLDPKVTEQLEAVANKYKFANYAEYEECGR